MLQPPARHVHDAGGAGVVAAVLDLGPGERGELFAEAHGRARFGEDEQVVGRRELVGDIGHGSLAAHDDPFVEGAEFVGVNGRGAAGHEHVGAGVVLERSADGLAGLLVGLAGDRAGVDDDGLRPLVVVHVAAGLHLGDDRVGLDAIDLAAQVHEGKLHRSSPSS